MEHDWRGHIYWLKSALLPHTDVIDAVTDADWFSQSRLKQLWITCMLAHSCTFVVFLQPKFSSLAIKHKPLHLLDNPA